MRDPAPRVDARLPGWKDKSDEGRSAVEARRERALKRTGRKPATGAEDSKRRDFLIGSFGMLWILGGLLIVILSLALLVGSFMMHGILEEISEARNFDDATARIDRYEEFFSDVAASKFKIVPDPPTIISGVTTYLWTVSPPGFDDPRSFSWEHDLEANEVRPTSNGALLLDIELGYVTAEEAPGLAHTFRYNAADRGALAIIERDVAFFAPGNAEGMSASASGAPGPLPPPLIDSSAKNRRNNSATTDEEEEEDPDAEADAEEGAEGQPPVPAPEPDLPPDEPPPPPIVVYEIPPPPAPEPEPEPEPPPPPEEDDEGEATPVG